MGYNSYVEGTMHIDKTKLNVSEGCNADDVFEQLLEQLDDEVGLHCDAEIPGDIMEVQVSSNDWGKYYALGTDLKNLMDAYPNVIVDMELIREGEESGDLENFYIKEGILYTSQAEVTIFYPKGSPVR